MVDGSQLLGPLGSALASSFPFQLELISAGAASERFLVLEYSRFSPKEDSGVFFHMATALKGSTWSVLVPSPAPTLHPAYNTHLLRGFLLWGIVSLNSGAGTSWCRQLEVSSRFHVLLLPLTPTQVPKCCVLGLQTREGELPIIKHSAWPVPSMATICWDHLIPHPFHG